MKTIEELFDKAIIENSSINNLMVEEVKFSKKTNSVIIYVNINKRINPLDIANFEENAKQCFALKSFKVKTICKVKGLELQEKDVKNIITYIGHYHPYANDMFKNCEVTIENNCIVKIFLDLPESKFLKLKKADETISQNLQSFFGIETKVDILDSSTAIEKLKEEVSNKKAIVKKEELCVALNSENNGNSKVKKDSVLGEKKQTEKAIDETEKSGPVIIGKDIAKDMPQNIDDIKQDDGRVCIKGQIISIDKRELKNGKVLLTIDVSDKTSTISCKAFLDSKKINEVTDRIKEGGYVKVVGRPQYDMYAKELTIMLNSMMEGNAPPKRKDNSENKRVELHMHTQMSTMDGVSSAKDIVNQAISFGHKAVAITDHGVVQSFPEAYMTAFDFKENKSKIKVIYGVEGYLISDVTPQIPKSNSFVVFDLETTGFSAGPDKITEIGAVKIENGKVIDEFSTFVNPERPIPKQVQEITNITNDMVKSSKNIDGILPEFLEFCEGSVVVAHNAKFDLSFINYFADKLELEKPKYCIDTLTIARELFESYENHKLGTITENLSIPLEDAHRAINDARATALVFMKMEELLKEKSIDINGYIQCSDKLDYKEGKANHIIVLAKNYVGLKNLYKIISYSHLHFFYKKPRMLRSLLNRYREGLIIGSACERGDLYQAILDSKKQNIEDTENIDSIAKYYDYLEIQPLGNNKFYLRNEELESEQDLIDINMRIVKLGDKLNIPVVATCDVHFLNEEDEIYRRIIMAGQGYEDADEQAPLYFRNTEEMLEEFLYLGDAKRKEVVITNTQKIADMVEDIAPVVSGTYNPTIDGSDEEIESLTYRRAKEIYGETLPTIVEERIKKELGSIITHGFSVMYLIAQKLVKKSNDDGYLVGSRGSVGSSFVATMTGITEVNPLPAHYVCPNCKYSEFPEVVVTTGVDMEDKNCPECGHALEKNGMDIPFETFLGFKGDKVPDIDLNFSGDYQAKAHAYTEVLFGKSKTFRAGTISTLAEKTAYGFVKKYYEEKKKTVLMPEINRLAKGCNGIKRTTGQHPGGIIVVPRDKEIYDFTPVQRPADDVRTKTITTHFDFHSIHDNLLKLDILGHDDPTVIRMLEDITGMDAKTIPLDEKKVMSLFKSTEALGVTPEQINSQVGTFAVPEFGTRFVRQMLVDTKPTTFGELVRISGLSHGTDVWINNAQTLIEQGTVTLREAICTRDDIMIYLIQKGLDPSIAFKIMEIVRKGKAGKLLTEELVDEMKKNDVPQWYIESCFKIKYMFPKAHAAAYVMMAYRIAYFKVYYPAAFYAVYYTVRADNFNSDIMCTDKKKVKESIKEYEKLPNPSQTEKDVLTILEVVNEMLERGIKFLPVDIYKSEAEKFKVEGDAVRPPLSALTGFGNINAKNLVASRKEEKFSSKENLMLRAKLGKVAIEILEKNGCLKGMPNSSQLNLFE